mgnify:CR=1 FL=1
MKAIGLLKRIMAEDEIIAKEGGLHLSAWYYDSVNSAIAELKALSKPKTCECCKYYKYCSKDNGLTNCAKPYHRCGNIEIEADGGWFRPPNKDFGCVLWEGIKNDQE